MSVTEDDIVRRKLLVDGGGGGDDKRLVQLQKYVIDFCSGGTGGGDEEVDTKCEKMIGMLCNTEYQAEKTCLLKRTAHMEQQQYDVLLTEINKRIESTQQEIETCKIELIAAKQIRRNKQEYDAWAKKVIELPDRQKTKSELTREQQVLGELEQTEMDLCNKLELRKKQFTLLMTSLYDLQQLVAHQDTQFVTSSKFLDEEEQLNNGNEIESTITTENN